MIPVDISQLLGKNSIDGTPLSFMWKLLSGSVTLATPYVTGFLHP